jgi:hypothetical protein
MLWLTASALLLSACQGSRQTSDAPPPETAQPSQPATRESPRVTAEPPRPIATQPSATTDGCVAACVRARQMEAVGIELIEATCRDACIADPNAYPRP